jgi:soluble lytic murein transglycosylase
MWRFSIWAAMALLFAGQTALAETVGVPPEMQEAHRAWRTGHPLEAATRAAKAAEKTQGPQRGAALFLRATALLAEQQWDAALSAFSEAAPLLPSLADRIFLGQGQALSQLRRYDEARGAYDQSRSASRIDVVAMRAELGRAQASLRAGSKRGVIRGEQFLRRYGAYPEKHRLQYEIALSREKAGGAYGARLSAKRYRELWLEYPDRLAGAQAGERLEYLHAQEVRLPAIGLTDRVERVRRLVAAREFEWAEQEIAGLLHQTKGPMRVQVLEQLAIVAHRRGDQERARHLLLELQEQGGQARHWLERNALAGGDTSVTAQRILHGRKATKRTNTARLVTLADVYLDAADYEKARQTLALVDSKRAPGYVARWQPWIDYQMGDYEKAAPNLLRRRREQNWSSGRRTYWQARAYHKGGNACAARRGYEQVITDAPHGYYGLWARKRLAQLAVSVASRRDDEGGLPQCPTDDTEKPQLAQWTPPDPMAGWALPRRQHHGPNEEETRRAFASLIGSHGQVLPWLGRTQDLWLAGDHIAAGEELRQAYWTSRGALAPKVGLPNLWGGRTPLTMELFPRGRKARLKARFSGDQLEQFVTLTHAVGSTGLAMRLKRPAWNDIERWHPHAYEGLVRSTAGRYGLPPELIWSIMRIESYFNRHALSHANAMGLMQILPRTGRRIARRKGAADFDVGQLYSPREGVDFAGWYLRALSDRFHGQTPLMIASYNGGPHNVASWITKRADRDEPLPMDEFLEEIPFTETYRYVRRVLASMAAYHALAGMPPPELPDFVNRDVRQGVNF